MSDRWFALFSVLMGAACVLLAGAVFFIALSLYVGVSR